MDRNTATAVALLALLAPNDVAREWAVNLTVKFLFPL
jgi:hypothetical protein